ncbi:SMI1/KNR4 family protein [Sphingobacterium sp. N143]|uniref:SMI1/KNR4 family protein n=1 Tax=Sphingobacterium sp. N143 TaxID=2746727 RepID=UPI002574F7C4|nr:SMI1/KNR4 family protein [Sphingobacterium sp. N143]MDM1295123.1 SMI1/KNR4 family protein [Sphingobacterium sp. N143]
MKTAVNYISALRNAYYENGGKKIWDNFEKIKHGASDENIYRLKQIYPALPETLIDLLLYVDGTYWRTYNDEKIALYFLGSDVFEYPYYLLSSEEMIENQGVAIAYYRDYINREYGHVEIDPKITDNGAHLNWLHFSDCMNNGGTSQLFIDFSPSGKGKAGQIVRFLHDPDEFRVIADNFEEYLQKLIDNQFDFIIEDYLE